MQKCLGIVQKWVLGGAGVKDGVSTQDAYQQAWSADVPAAPCVAACLLLLPSPKFLHLVS